MDQGFFAGTEWHIAWPAFVGIGAIVLFSIGVSHLLYGTEARRARTYGRVEPSAPGAKRASTKRRSRSSSSGSSTAAMAGATSSAGSASSSASSCSSPDGGGGAC